MKPQELTAEFDRIESQIKLVKSQIGQVPDDIVALACQQICVSICGSLEQQLKAILVEHAKRISNSRIHRPIYRLCEGYQNPKTGKIVELVSLFDRDFGTGLEVSWKDESEAECSYINSLVADRINIAHRKKTHIQVGTAKLDNYFTSYKSICTRVYEHFLRP